MNCKERLTEKAGDQYCVKDYTGVIMDCEALCSEVDGDCDECPLQMAYNKLGVLEDKLENGTLIEVDENYHTHICKAKGLINGFSIFARVVDETDDTVTIERYQEFGALKIKNITISKEDFERYYKKISEVQCFLPKKKPKQG